MKKFVHLILLLLPTAMLWAQDEAIFTHYNLAPILINPAAAGFEETHQIQFNARGQWLGFPDAPKNVGVQYHGPLGNTFGFGLAVMGESAAQVSRVRGRLNTGFRFKVNENVKLAIGFSTEFSQLSLGNNILGEPDYQQGDDIIEAAVNGRQQFDASLGFFGRFYENTYASLSFTNLISERLNNIVSNEAQGSLFQYYVFLVGHKFELSNNQLSLEPSIMVRQVKDTPFNVDINLKAGILNDKLIAGLSYRSLKTIGALIGSEISESFRFFYTFDLSMQDLQQYSTGSHEITLAFGFKGPQNKPGSRYGRR
ncbi:PorP/SprF family type IX secretion system membrane protein [Haliscomenobacter hydrossis]|nr:PorP/SprF family type IX secretion system membrane protein [Haliscomenobacter hydrossis]